jgi:hypothetical protein
VWKCGGEEKKKDISVYRMNPIFLGRFACRCALVQLARTVRKPCVGSRALHVDPTEHTSSLNGMESHLTSSIRL